MTKIAKRMLSILWIIMIILAGCSGADDQALAVGDAERITLPEGENVPSLFQNPSLPGMKGIAETADLQLFLHEQTGEIAVLDKIGGHIWRSNPADRNDDAIATGLNKDLLHSQASISFYNSFGQLGSVNSYTDSMAYKQVAYESLPDGLRVTYQFGTDAKTVDDMPLMLSKSRFEELTGKLDKTGSRALIIAYREDKEQGLYVRNDNALQGLQLQRALDALEEAGYTADDLQRDIEELNLQQMKPIPRIFRLSIEYRLDGDSLIVKVPKDRIEYPQDYPVHMVTLLRFFGAGGADEEGALFVPDGSGALIHFNNGKTKYPSYQQYVFGRDLTMERTNWSRDQTIRLPVFGVMKKDAAFIGIIEEGASAAVMNADVSGRLNNYNYVYPSFVVINQDEVTLSASDQNRSLPRFQEKPMQADFVVRYAFLRGEEASYRGMAHYYRNYLVDRGMLRKTEALESGNENAPFYLQLIGSIPKQKHVLGIPYRALEPLTTTDEARAILEQLKERGIDHIRLKYSGWFNGGLDHKVPTTISVDRAIGGVKGLKQLMEYAAEENIAIFPDIALLSVGSGSGFRESKDAARKLTNAPAAVYPIDLALNRRDRERTPSYVLSPRLVERYAALMKDQLQQLAISSVSLRDLADQLNSDYRKHHLVDRTESEQISRQALDSLYEAGLTMMADGGNVYALSYLTDITNAPLSSSRFKIEDESVPFYQMVVRGYVDYTGAPYNLSTYTNPQQYILQCLEYGSHVSFTWIAKQNDKVKDTEYDYLYAVHYDGWLELAEHMYEEVNSVLKLVQHAGIIHHEKRAEGVYETVYENGVSVIVNYNRSPVTINGITIAPESFVTGGEQA